MASLEPRNRESRRAVYRPVLQPGFSQLLSWPPPTSELLGSFQSVQTLTAPCFMKVISAFPIVHGFSLPSLESTWFRSRIGEVCTINLSSYATCGLTRCLPVHVLKKKNTPATLNFVVRFAQLAGHACQLVRAPQLATVLLVDRCRQTVLFMSTLSRCSRASHSPDCLRLAPMSDSGHSPNFRVDCFSLFVSICALFAQRGLVAPFATPQRAPRPSPLLRGQTEPTEASDPDIYNDHENDIDSDSDNENHIDDSDRNGDHENVKN